LAINIIKIFPAIGIARLGNSPDAFFIGPEIPNDDTPPPGGYKDSQCRLKRQAAHFRLFGYEGRDLKQEITLDDAEIKWTVQLANTKAEWKEFGKGMKDTNTPLRNAKVVNRADLRITPEPGTLDGPDQKAAFDTGFFLGQSVPLGEMRTDADGRLLVLGGFGNSTSPDNIPLNGTFADNDGWHDDVSDGPVTASIHLKGTDSWIQASSAWVICAPPKFAPPIKHIITLYDTLLQVAVDRSLPGVETLLPATPPSFTKDIYPLLVRAMNMKWVSSQAVAMHSTFQNVIHPPGLAEDRQAIFDRLRNPDTDLKTQPDTDPRQDMPRIWSDLYDRDPFTRRPITQALTKTQYQILQQWKDGNFTNSWTDPLVQEIQITPDGLTRAALETCVGAAFYPGIETSFMTRDTYAFVEPFRLDAGLSPGDLTKQMAVPWQSDFLDCALDHGLQWWPAQRPDDVFPPSGPQKLWIRGGKDWHIESREDMVENWHKLGFVVQQGDRFVETERCE
jgi:hypothetical protein